MKIVMIIMGIIFIILVFCLYCLILGIPREHYEDDEQMLYLKQWREDKKKD